MSAFHYRNFDDRRQYSQNAKAALLEKFKSRPSFDDPDMIAKAEHRKEVAQARDAREREEAEATALAARNAQETEERKAARDTRKAGVKIKR